MTKYNFTDDQLTLMRRALEDHPRGEALTVGEMIADYGRISDITVWECSGGELAECDLDEVARMRSELNELAPTFGNEASVKTLLHDALTVPSRYHDPYEVLQEFVADVKSAYGTGYGDEIDEESMDFPDMADTYRHALECLNWSRRARTNSENPIRIKEWLSEGEIGAHPDFRSLLKSAGGMLDSSGSTDLFGTVLFVSEDDRTFVLSCEGVIAEADPEYVKDFLSQTGAGPS